jgi:hypothetical protein
VGLPDGDTGVAVDEVVQRQGGFERLVGQRTEEGTLGLEVLPDGRRAAGDPPGVVGEVRRLDPGFEPCRIWSSSRFRSCGRCGLCARPAPSDCSAWGASGPSPTRA